MGKITVIDAPCGQGKTSWAIQMMNAHKKNNYIFCTPFLKEIDRIQENCEKSRFPTPQPYNDSGTKIEGFNRLLAEDKCVAVTHTTFLNATEETLELIRHGGYSLIIDEALEVVAEFNHVQSVEKSPRQSIKQGDLKMLLEREIIRIGENGRIIWCGGEYGDDCKFSEVERFAKLGRLFCAQGKLLLVIFPPELFEAFENVYVLTYMFGGSLMKYYFDIFEIPYEMKSVCTVEESRYLVDYEKSYDTAFRRQCKELIHICGNERLNNYGKNALSKTWYDNSGKDERLKDLRNNISNYFCRYLKAESPKASNGDIMWTCIGEYEGKLKGKGYTTQRNLTADERKLSGEEQKKLQDDLKCFVPCNARATNDFKNRWALAYCVNMYYNPMTRGFFEDFCNELTGQKGLVKPDDDLYAVSCMVQWIFRSRIRDGLPVYVYIPNKRMRDLLIAWLNDEI